MIESSPCPRLPVLQAWEIAAGQGLDVDVIAKQRVKAGLDPDTRFKAFATVEEGERYQDPHGHQGRYSFL